MAPSVMTAAAVRALTKASLINDPSETRDRPLDGARGGIVLRGQIKSENANFHAGLVIKLVSKL